MSLNLNVNLSTTGQNQLGTDTSQPSTVGQTGWSGSSTLEQTVTIGGQLTINFDYPAPTNNPQLLKPDPNARPLTQYDTTQPPPAGPNDTDTEVINYYETVANDFNGLLDQQAPPMTENEVAQLVHAYMTDTPPDDSTDPRVKTVLDALNIDVEKLNSQIPDGSPLKGKLQNVKDSYKSQMQTDYSSAIQQRLALLGHPPPTGKNLSAQVIAKIAFAIYNPNYADPAVQELVRQVMADALADIAPQYGLTPNSKVPLNQAKFNAQLSSKYYSALSAAIDKKLASMSLSPEDAQKLKDQILYKYSYPDADVGDQVAALASELEGEVTTSFNADNGIPSGFTVPISPTFTNMINGMVHIDFAYNLQNWQPPIDSNTQAAINSALQSGSISSLPADIQTLFSQIYDQTVSAVISQCNIPDPSWQPDAATLAQLGKPLSPQIQTAVNLVNSAQQQVQLMLNVVTTMPPGPQQALYLNVLKEISMALADIKRAIASAQGVETNLEMKLNTEQSNEQVLKNQEQLNEIQTQQKKEAKMKPLQEMMKFLGPLKYIMMAVMAVLGGALLGPVGVIMALAVCALMIADDVMGDKGPIKQLMNAITKNVSSPGLQLFCKMLVTLVVCVCAGPFLGGQFAFENANLFGSILQLCGVPESAANIANMVMDMVFQMASMILMTVVSGGAMGALLVAQAVSAVAEIGGFVCRAVVAVAKLVSTVGEIIGDAIDAIKAFLGVAPKILAEVVDTADEVLPSVTRAAERCEEVAKDFETLADFTAKTGRVSQIFKDKINVLTTFLRVKDVATGLAGIAQGVMSAEVAALKKQLDQITGDLDSMIASLEGILKNLRKVLQMLMDAIKDQGDWYKDLGQVMSSFWASNTQTITNISTATHG